MIERDSKEPGTTACDLAAVDFETLLVYPPDESAQGRAMERMPPLGVPLLKGYLRLSGYGRVRALDLGRWSSADSAKRPSGARSLEDSISVALSDDVCVPLPKEIDASLTSGRLGLLGISVVFPAQLFPALRIARAVKSVVPDVFTVLGGPQISRNLAQISRAPGMCRIVDGFVIGHGEQPLSELVRQLAARRDLGAVPNLWYVDADGRYRPSPESFIADGRHLLEPDFGDFENIDILPIRASIGCAWAKCRFCSYPRAQGRYQRADPEKVAELIAALERLHGVGWYRFVDDFLPPAYLAAIAEHLISKGVRVDWSAFFALVKGYDRERIALLRRAGFKSAIIGLESMNGRVLASMGKPHDPETAKEVIDLLEDAGVDISICVMFGFPKETAKEAEQTLFWVIENSRRFKNVAMQQFALEEGTDVFVNPASYGITRIYPSRGHYGSRRGYGYEVARGMSWREAREFTIRAKTRFMNEAVYPRLSTDLTWTENAEPGKGCVLSKAQAVKQIPMSRDVWEAVRLLTGSRTCESVTRDLAFGDGRRLGEHEVLKAVLELINNKLASFSTRPSS